MTPLPFSDSSKGHTQAIQRASLSLKPSFFPANMLENLDLSSLVEGLVLIWNNGVGGDTSQKCTADQEDTRSRSPHRR